MSMRLLILTVTCLCVMAAPALAEGYPTQDQVLVNPGFDLD